MNSGIRTLRMRLVEVLFFISPMAFCAAPDATNVQDKESVATEQEITIDPLSPFLLEQGVTLDSLEKEVQEISGDLDDASTYLKPETARKVFGDAFENLTVEEKRCMMAFMIVSLASRVTGRVEGNDSSEFQHFIDKAASFLINHRVEWLTTVDVVFSDPVYAPFRKDVRELFICLRVLVAKLEKTKGDDEQKEKVYRQLLKIRDNANSIIVVKNINQGQHVQVLPRKTPLMLNPQEISVPLRVNLQLAPANVYSVPENMTAEINNASPESELNLPPKFRGKPTKKK